MEDKYKKVKNEEDEPELGEKHVPVVELDEGEEVRVNVEIGSNEHPMEPEHFIQWIEVLDGDISLSRVYLTHMDKPKVVFTLKQKPENLKVREYCNRHGTWEYNE